MTVTRAGPHQGSSLRARFYVDGAEVATSSVGALAERLMELLVLGHAPASAGGPNRRVTLQLEVSLPEDDGLVETVRRMLLSQPGPMQSLADIAAQLYLSQRTLSRRLRDEGTSFRELAESVREAMAHDLLCSAGMTTEQVSARLGYAEPSCFVRAFKRWTGMTPQAFRGVNQREQASVDPW